MKTKILFYLTLIAGLVFVFSFTQPGGGPWAVPEKYKTMKNPVKADKASLSAGSALYVKHCKSCHGKEGLGDGTKAAQLETKCGDFTSKTFQSQSDGAIFYKAKEGRDDMPSFKKKIPDDEDIWNLVNYMRTLKG